MEIKRAADLIEKAWDAGFTGELGPRPAEYKLFVEDNSVVFSKLQKDDEEMVHLCLKCILLDRDFVSSLVGGDPDPHLKTLVCLTTEQKVKYLSDLILGSEPTVYSV